MKKFKSLLLVIAGVLSFANCLLADNTFSTVTVPSSSFILNKNETETLKLQDWHYVKKIFVEAQGESSQGGMMEVRVNGDIKGSIYVPGSDPHYIVTIEETTDRLSFSWVSGGAIRIFEVKALQSETIPGGGGGNIGPLPNQGLATHLSSRAINSVDTLRPFVDPETEYVKYLLQIKSTAGRAQATASVFGDLSPKTKAAMIVLAKQIDYAEQFLSNLMKIEKTFDLAVNLMSVKYAIYEKFK